MSPVVDIPCPPKSPALPEPDLGRTVDVLGAVAARRGHRAPLSALYTDAQSPADALTKAFWDLLKQMAALAISDEDLIQIDVTTASDTAVTVVGTRSTNSESKS